MTVANKFVEIYSKNHDFMEVLDQTHLPAYKVHM